MGNFLLSFLFVKIRTFFGFHIYFNVILQIFHDSLFGFLYYSESNSGKKINDDTNFSVADEYTICRDS